MDISIDLGFFFINNTTPAFNFGTIGRTDNFTGLNMLKKNTRNKKNRYFEVLYGRSYFLSNNLTSAHCYGLDFIPFRKKASVDCN